MSDEEKDLDAWMAAAADQMDAALEQHKAKLFEIYLDCNALEGDEAPAEPIELWEESGVWCAVLLGPVGALCGYARLPDGHPWIALHADDRIPHPVALDREQTLEQAMDDHGPIPMFAATHGGEEALEEYEATLAAAVPVHGGITWTGPMPIAGAPHGWWLGFDCGHAGDAVSLEWMKANQPWASELMIRMRTEGHLWTVEEVALEVKRMVPPILAAQNAKCRSQSERKGTQGG